MRDHGCSTVTHTTVQTHRHAVSGLIPTDTGTNLTDALMKEMPGEYKECVCVGLWGQP